MTACKEFPTRQPFIVSQVQPRDWAGWPGAAERAHMTVRSAVNLLPEADRLSRECSLMSAEINPARKDSRKRKLAEECKLFAEEYHKARIPTASARAGMLSGAHTQQLPAPERHSVPPASPGDGPSRFDLARQRGGKLGLPPGSAGYTAAQDWNGPGQPLGQRAAASVASYGRATSPGQRLRAGGTPEHPTESTRSRQERTQAVPTANSPTKNRAMRNTGTIPRSTPTAATATRPAFSPSRATQLAPTQYSLAAGGRSLPSPRRATPLAPVRSAVTAGTQPGSVQALPNSRRATQLAPTVSSIRSASRPGFVHPWIQPPSAAQLAPTVHSRTADSCSQPGFSRSTARPHPQAAAQVQSRAHPPRGLPPGMLPRSTWALPQELQPPQARAAAQQPRGGTVAAAPSSAGFPVVTHAPPPSTRPSVSPPGADPPSTARLQTSAVSGGTAAAGPAPLPPLPSPASPRGRPAQVATSRGATGTVDVPPLMQQHADADSLLAGASPVSASDTDTDLGSQPDALLQTAQEKAHIVAQRALNGALQGAANMEYLLAFEGYGEDESVWYPYTMIAESYPDYTELLEEWQAICSAQQAAVQSAATTTAPAATAAAAVAAATVAAAAVSTSYAPVVEPLVPANEGAAPTAKAAAAAAVTSKSVGPQSQTSAGIPEGGDAPGAEDAPDNAAEGGVDTEEQELEGSAMQGQYVRQDPGYVPFTQDMTQADLLHQASRTTPAESDTRAAASPGTGTGSRAIDRTEAAHPPTWVGSQAGGTAMQPRRGPGALSSMMACFKQGFSELISGNPSAQERLAASAQAAAARPEPSEHGNATAAEAPREPASASGQQPAGGGGARTRARAATGSRAQAEDAAPGQAPVGDVPSAAAMLSLSDDYALDDGASYHRLESILANLPAKRRAEEEASIVEGERASKRPRCDKTAAIAPPKSGAAPGGSTGTAAQAEASLQGAPQASPSRASEGVQSGKGFKKEPSFRRIDPLSTTGVAPEAEPGSGRPADSGTRTVSTQAVSGEDVEGVTSIAPREAAALASLAPTQEPLRVDAVRAMEGGGLALEDFYAPPSASAIAAWSEVSPELRRRLRPAGWASATIKGAQNRGESLQFLIKWTSDNHEEYVPEAVIISRPQTSQAGFLFLKSKIKQVKK